MAQSVTELRKMAIENPVTIDWTKTQFVLVQVEEKQDKPVCPNCGEKLTFGFCNSDWCNG